MYVAEKNAGLRPKWGLAAGRLQGLASGWNQVEEEIPRSLFFHTFQEFMRVPKADASRD